MLSWSVIKNGKKLFGCPALLSIKFVRFTSYLRWCLHGSDRDILVGLALFAEISPSCVISCNICFRLHVRRGSLLQRDLVIDCPRSHPGRLEISHVNTLRAYPLKRMRARFNLVRRARKFPCKSELKSSPFY